MLDGVYAGFMSQEGHVTLATSSLGVGKTEPWSLGR